ncbi:MAG: PAS-domain containing protein [Alphaproteobacteria bacterium]
MLIAALALAVIVLAALSAWLWRERSRQAAALLRAGQDETELQSRLAAAETGARQSSAARAAAEDETARWRAVLEALPLPLWRRDGEGAIAWHNPAYGRTVDHDGDGEPPEIESALAPGSARAMAQAAMAAGAEETQTRYFVVDGQRRALQVAEKPESGGVLGFAVDVTDREDQRAELKRHVDANAQILDHLNTAIAIFGRDRRLSYFNSAFTRCWRLDEDWLAEQPTHGELLDAMRDSRLLPEQADFAAYRASIQALYTTLLEPTEALEYLPDGRVLRRVISPHPMGGLLFFYEDVTDRLALERSYNTLIAVQRDTLDHLYEGVALFGSDGRLKLFNPAFQQVWNLDKQMLEQEPHIAEIVDSLRPIFDERGDWAETRAEMITQVTEREAQAGRVEAADGRLLDFAALPLPDGNMLFTYLDVTDSVLIERALRERNEALETADRLKSEFIANVSYELRTPLNVINGFSEILDAEYFGELNERQKEYADGILRSSRQLMTLINDILDLATIEAGRLELDPKRFDIREALVAVQGLAREAARVRELDIDVACASDIGSIEADESRIKQALFNLASNAIKFTPPGGQVTVGADRDADEVRLWVEDNGVGIPEGDQDVVFERFHRGRQWQRGAGAGLGLSLVRSFIEMHGGRVNLESRVDEGTRVTCHLPPAATVGATGEAAD